MDFTALRSRQRSLLEKADAAASKAVDAGRDLTAAERKQITDAFEEAKTISEQIKALDEGPATATKAEVNGWAAAVRKAGAKALVPSGQLQVPAPWSEIAGFGAEASLIGTVIPSTGLEATDTFSYLRQTVRTNNAAVVPAGAVKPTSVISLEKIEDKARTIATLSEPIDNALVADVNLLEAFIGRELADMVLLATNTEVLQGIGDPDNITGLLNVSGRQVQAFDTDMLTTIRKAVTLVGVQYEGMEPDFLLVHPNDAETLDLAKDLEGRYYFGGPVDGGAGRPNSVWRTRLHPTRAIPEGVGLTSLFRASTRAHVREETQITWSEGVVIDVAGTPHAAFELNQRKYRAEHRVGLEVSRPAALVEIDLTAGS
jgi:HK97 family phage major capsid protein